MSRYIYEIVRTSMNLEDFIEYIKDNLDENDCVFWEEVYGFDDGGEYSTWETVKFDMNEKSIAEFKEKNKEELDQVCSPAMKQFKEQFSEVLESNINTTQNNMRILREAEAKAKQKGSTNEDRK